MKKIISLLICITFCTVVINSQATTIDVNYKDGKLELKSNEVVINEAFLLSSDKSVQLNLKALIDKGIEGKEIIVTQGNDTMFNWPSIKPEEPQVVLLKTLESTVIIKYKPSSKDETSVRKFVIKLETPKVAEHKIEGKTIDVNFVHDKLELKSNGVVINEPYLFSSEEKVVLNLDPLINLAGDERKISIKQGDNEKLATIVITKNISSTILLDNKKSEVTISYTPGAKEKTITKKFTLVEDGSENPAPVIKIEKFTCPPFFPGYFNTYKTISKLYCEPVEGCKTCKNAKTIRYRVIYDYLNNGEIYYLKLKRRLIERNNIKSRQNVYIIKKRFRPMNGDEVVFEVINYPSNDFPTFNYQYESRHTEGAEQFSRVVSEKFIDLPSSSTEDVNNHVRKAVDSNIDDVIGLIGCFSEQATTYLSHRISARSSYDLYYDEINIIKKNVAENLGVDLFIPNRFSNKYLEAAGSNTSYIQTIQTADSLANQMLAYKINVISSIQIEDEDQLNFTFKNNKGETLIKRKALIRLGFKIDFSAGIFYTGLFDHTYAKKDTTVIVNNTDTTTGSIIIRKDEGQFNIGFGLLSHFYTRTASLANFGGCFGFIMDTQTKFRFLFGGSLMLGGNNRFCINGGIALGSVQRIADGYRTGYYTDALGTPQFFTNETVPVIQQVQVSYFAGLTYNFASIKLSRKN